MSSVRELGLGLRGTLRPTARHAGRVRCWGQRRAQPTVRAGAAGCACSRPPVVPSVQRSCCLAPCGRHFAVRRADLPTATLRTRWRQVRSWSTPGSTHTMPTPARPPMSNVAFCALAAAHTGVRALHVCLPRQGTTSACRPPSGRPRARPARSCPHHRRPPRWATTLSPPFLRRRLCRAARDRGGLNPASSPGQDTAARPLVLPPAPSRAWSPASASCAARAKRRRRRADHDPPGPTRPRWRASR